MSSSQFLTIRPLLSEEQYDTIEKYFKSLSSTCKLTASNFSCSTKIDFPLAQKVLKSLVDAKVLKHFFGIRCPTCGILLQSVESLALIEKQLYCYHCEENVEITTDDVEVFYSFNEYPFALGQQQSDSANAPMQVAALGQDSLAQLLRSNNYDLYAEFFSPTEEEYSNLKNLYADAFQKGMSTKKKGDALEALTMKLFNLCAHFRAKGIRLKPNQIDCYVRNKLFIPGISQANCLDSFIIECKNEAKTPKSTYMNKLHSILRLSGKQFGIIVSRSRAPKTYATLAHQLYLGEKIIMITFDREDLKLIVMGKANLLECMARKIDEVKLDATKSLVELGLYQS